MTDSLLTGSDRVAPDQHLPAGIPSPQWLDAFIAAIAPMCGGKAPAREVVVAFFVDDDLALQEFAVNNSVAEVAGIEIIETAMAMVDVAGGENVF